MLTLRPGRAEGQMWNQRSHTVSMFDKDEEMLKKVAPCCDSWLGQRWRRVRRSHAADTVLTVTTNRSHYWELGNILM